MGVNKKTKIKKIQRDILKETGTRDLIWIKVGSLDRSWLVGRAYGRPLNIFKVLLYTFNNFFLQSLVVLAKFMPIANVNRIGFVN